MLRICVVDQWPEASPVMSGGFKVEVRESVIEKDLIGSLGVEAFSGASVEL